MPNKYEPRRKGDVPVNTDHCRASVADDIDWGRYHQCTRKAVRDGWCTQHHPDTVRVRKEAKELRRQERFAKSTAGILEKRNEEIAHLRQVIQAAAEEAYEQEVVMTEMERHIIGEGKDFYDKADWIASKIAEWEEDIQEER